MDSDFGGDNSAVAQFLMRNQTAVLATAAKDNAVPHAAAIYYTVTSKFNLFFVTKKDTTKARNIESNPQVAMVIYEAASQTTVQLTGTATTVDDPERLGTALNVMASQAQAASQTKTLPASELDAGIYVLYKVTPQRIRLADFKHPGGGQIFHEVVPSEESLN